MHATGQLVSRFRAVVTPLKVGAGVRLELHEQGGILPLAQDCLGHSRLSRATPSGSGRHAGVVPVYEAGRYNDRPWYVMRLIRGRALQFELSACRGLGERLRYISAFRDVCNAVAYAHQAGVVHRDLKPDNVLVSKSMQSKVADFGESKIFELDAAAENEQQLAADAIDGWRGLEHHADRQVAETAERVTKARAGDV